VTGGATAVREGWQPSTVDVDAHFDPGSDSLLRVLPAIKEELQVNVELADPRTSSPSRPRCLNAALKRTPSGD
jgi:hypothetical protein